MRARIFLAGALSGAMLLPFPASGNTPAEDMHLPRWDVEAVTLEDGRVLVIGEPRVVAARSSEIYDPSTEDWSLGPPPLTPRSYPEMLLLDDGRVFVVGGGYFPNGPGAEIFDPASSTWQATAPMSRKRTDVGAAKLNDGRVLVFGGRPYEGGSNWDFDAVHTAEIYDPVADSWRFAADLEVRRKGPATAVLQDGSILAIGGERTRFVTTVERYLPGQDEWISWGTLPGPREGQRVTGLADGRVLATGGCCVTAPTGVGPVVSDAPLAPQPSMLHDDIFGWMPTPMPSLRFDHSMTMLSDGRVLVAGGGEPEPGSPYSTQELRDISVFDPRTNLWTRLLGLIQPRRRHAAALLPDGSVLIAGGWTNDVSTVTAEVIRP